jgi:hypothetical protein
MQLQIKHDCTYLCIFYIMITAILSLSMHHKLIPNTDKDFLFSTAPKCLGPSTQWIPWLFPYR